MNSTATRLAATGAGLLVIASLGLAAAPAYAGDATFPPTAVEDNYSTPQDTQLLVDAANGLLANDSDGGNAGLVVNSVSTSPDGEITFGADGHFEFTPNGGFVGTAHFTYDDVAGSFPSNVSDIYIVVTQAAPYKLVGAPDFYTTPKDTVLETDPGANDLIVNDPDTTYVGGIDDATGEVDVNIYGRLTYTPAPGFVGTKTFSYFLDDGYNISSDWILVTIEVTEPVITIIPSDPLTPGDSGTTGGELPTLAYTGTDDVTTWLIAPGIAMLGFGAFAVWFARRRAAL